eukprot:29570-Pelagococcus_subviridis.AAC.15
MHSCGRVERRRRRFYRSFVSFRSLQLLSRHAAVLFLSSVDAHLPPRVVPPPRYRDVRPRAAAVEQRPRRRRRRLLTPKRSEVQMRLRGEPDAAALAEFIPPLHPIADLHARAVRLDVHVLHEQRVGVGVPVVVVASQHDAVPLVQVPCRHPRQRVLLNDLLHDPVPHR